MGWVDQCSPSDVAGTASAVIPEPGVKEKAVKEQCVAVEDSPSHITGHDGTRE